MLGPSEFYIDASTGKASRPPHYERWYKLAKYCLNITTIALAVAIYWGSKGKIGPALLILLFTLAFVARILEILKDSAPLLHCCCRNSDQRWGNVCVCLCSTPESAVAADKVLKYTSSLALSGLFAGLCFWSLIHRDSIKDWATILLLFVSFADMVATCYVVVEDHCVKDRRTVRQRPNNLDFDEILQEDEGFNEGAGQLEPLAATSKQHSRLTGQGGPWDIDSGSSWKPAALSSIASIKSESNPLRPANAASSSH